MAVSDHRPLKVAIIGGGIGGLCAALSLHYHCKDALDIDIYEQAGQYREIGAAVGIGVNAAKLIYKIGLGEKVAEIAGNPEGVWLSFRKFDDGSDVVTVKSADTDKVKQLSVHRAEFLGLLVEAVKERKAARLHTYKRGQRFTDQGDQVLIEFGDGTNATANLVIGCDGIHSTVRAQYAKDNPEYSGRIAYRSLVPISEIKDWWGFDTYAITWVGKNRHFLCTPVSQNRFLSVVAFVAETENNLGDLKESWTALGKKEDVFEAYKLFEERVQKVITLMPEQPSKWLINDRKPLDQWVYSGGKVVLMGDAAHAMTPHQGAGAGQAIEDGYILARALEDYFRTSLSSTAHSLAHWATVYQDVRLPRAQRVQRTSRDAVELYQAQADIMKDLPFAQCVPEIHKRVVNRMKWVWTDDIDAEYDAVVNKGQEAAKI